MGPQIFISHAQEDESVARQMAKRLEDEGYGHWMFERNVLIDSHLKLVKEAIEKSKAFILFVTIYSIQSRYVDKEVEQAFDCDIPILPVLIGISRDEMILRRPNWAIVIGSIVCPEVPEGGLRPAFDQVVLSLRVRIDPSTDTSGESEAPGSGRINRIRGDEVPVKPLFGREQEIKSIMDLIQKRSLAVTGIRGIGKSTVISAVVRHLFKSKNSCFQEYYFRRFDYLDPPVFSKFSRTFVNDFEGPEVDLSGSSASEQVHMVARILNERACLLAIDQFESVIDPETRKPRDHGFADLLGLTNQNLAGGRLLVTSWEVPKDASGLDFPHIPIGILDEPSSRRILDSGLAKDQPQSRRDELMTILYRLLRGHPYALTLLAGNYSIEELYEMVVGDSDLKKGTIAAVSSKVAEKVVGRLPPNLRKILEAVCIFTKPCPRNGIAFVAGAPKLDTFEGLTELRKRSLVFCVEEKLYDCQDLVREHVIGKLSHTDKHRLDIAAGEYFLSLPRLPTGKRSDVIDAQSLIDATSHFIRASRHDRAAELILDEGIARDAFGWGVLPVLRGVLESVDTRELGVKGSRILSYLGLALRDLGDYRGARERYVEGQEISRECGDQETQCLQLVNLGDALYYLGEFDKSIEYHARAMGFFAQDIPLPRDLEARNCGCMGNPLSAKGDLKGAERHYDRAAQICDEIGEKRYLGIWLGNLGSVFEQRGETAKAIIQYEKAISLAREANDRRHASWWLGISGNALIRSGETKRGLISLEEALAISERIGFRRGMRYQTEVLTQYTMLEDDNGRLLESLRRVVRESDKKEGPFAVWKHRFLLGHHLMGKAVAAIGKGQPEAAIDLCREAVECLFDYPHAYRILGTALRKFGKVRGDRESLMKGVECLTRVIQISPDADAYEDRAACCYYANDLEKALTDYERVLLLTPRATGSTLSKMETEIALGRFEQTRKTFENLDIDRLSPSEMAIAFCWMAISLALDGLPNSDYLSRLESIDVVLTDDFYDPKDIEPHLRRLYKSGIPADWIAAAERAYQLLISKYRRNKERS